MLKFIQAYVEWKRLNREEVMKLKLYKQMMKTPLNYETLAEIFKLYTEKTDNQTKMDITGNGFTVTFYRDVDGTVKKVTRTEQILNQYKGAMI